MFGVECICFVVLLIGSANIVRATSVESPSNDTGVCEATICSKLEYYDKLKQKCRDFPGGGFLVIMDHSTKCAHGDSGLHTFSRRDFYYVCHPDGVMIGLCPDNTVFSDTEKRCIGQTVNQPNTIKVHDESQNCNIIVPDCSAVGLFPIPSNCSFYFKCQEHNYNFHQYVYQCPPGTFFHPDLQKCSSTNKCYEAQEEILHNFSKEYFPECHIYGQFRTAKDCSLYYRCVPNMDGSFYQIRYECPYKMYYNIEKEICVPEHLQCCEYIPHERIIEQYKAQHLMDSTTLHPHPTTVISAINTKITSNVPLYYDTTQPLYLNDAQSLARETSARYGTTASVYDEDQVIISTEIPDYGDYLVVTDNDETFISAVTPEYGDYSYDLSERETADGSYTPQVSVEQFYSTQAQNKDPQTTVEVNTSSADTELESASEKPATKTPFGYDEMEWDDDAWDIPGRVRPVQTPPPTLLFEENTINNTGTQSNNEVYVTEEITEFPDHFPSSEPTVGDTSVELYDEVPCEMLSYSTEPTFDAVSSFVTTSTVLEQNVFDYTNNQSTSAEQSFDAVTEIIVQDTEEQNSSSANEEAMEIKCTTDKDGEIVCNGEKLSVNGYLELLGYALEFKKWQELPDVPNTGPKPTIKFHFTIEYPYNYMFKAQAIDYRTSYSYELTSPASIDETNDTISTLNYEQR